MNCMNEKSDFMQNTEIEKKNDEKIKVVTSLNVKKGSVVSYSSKRL